MVMRIITDFASDRATLTTSSTAGVLVAANMQRNEKAAVWRSTSTTATITATWTSAVDVDSLALGWTNLSSTATVTVNLFSMSEDEDPVASMTVSPDTQLASPGGMSPQVQAWFSPSRLVEKVTVDISDPDNVVAYVEVSRLCVGKRVELSKGPSYGASLKFVDRSKSSRAESGDLRIESASMYRTLDLDFSMLPPADAEIMARLATKGAGAFVFLSVAPGDAVGFKRQAYAFFSSPVISNLEYPFLSRWSNKLTLEEIA